jgi:hypothetical protein
MTLTCIGPWVRPGTQNERPISFVWHAVDCPNRNHAVPFQGVISRFSWHGAMLASRRAVMINLQ